LILICRVVRLSSPKLNYLIIAGALILYITLYLVVYPNNGSNPFAFEVICNVSHLSVIRTIRCVTHILYLIRLYLYLLCVHMQIFYASGIGVSLCVGTIQGKMFRIFYIFRNPSPVKKVVG